ncbi:MAG: DUF4405 domain-containing protein [Chloroflexota bacterium]|nr:DUF4405 domain-containing protein [Chloroflexota bacterium]
MRRAMIYYLLDLVLALLSLLLGVSSFLLWVVFPRGYFPARVLWVDIHKWSGLALGVAVLLHVALHWSWLIRMTRRQIAYVQNVTRRTAQRLFGPTGGEKS